MSLEDMDQIARAVDSVVEQTLSGTGRVKTLYDASMHLFRAGGKRVRPYILVKSAQMLGADARQAMRFAAAIEILHTFTLIHDDIMDMSDLRRGMPSVHSVFGAPTAIISGDLLFGIVFEVVNSSQVDPVTASEVSFELARTTRRICEGQHLDMSLQGKLEPGDRIYYEMIEKKTAALFEASAAIGGMLAQAQKSHLQSLREFGRSLGLAFQIKDDVLGLVGDSTITGKPSGDDLIRGKFTAIVSHFCTAASPPQLRELRECYNNPRAGEARLRKAVELLAEVGSIAHAEKMVGHYTERCLSSLKELPRNDANQALESLADYMLGRRA